MRIYNATSVWGTRLNFKGNNAAANRMSTNKSSRYDTVSIIKSAKDGLGKQTKVNSVLDSLLKQKQNIIDSKNSLIEKTTENNGSLGSIKEQLKEFEKQIKDIDKQIAEFMVKDQLTQLDSDKKEDKASENKPKSKQEVQNEQLNNIVSLSGAVSQIQVVSSVKSEMLGQGNVLEIEIELDESRGQNAEAKSELLSEIEDKIPEMNETIGETLKAVDEKVKNTIDDQNNTKEEVSEKVSNQQAQKVESYKELQDSLVDQAPGLIDCFA